LSNKKGKKEAGSFYRFIITLGIGTSFSILGDSTIYAVLPLHLEAAGITLAGAGILMGINRLVRLLSNTVSGYLFDFGNKRILFIFSLLTGAFSTLMCAIFTGFWPLFIARILWGVAYSGVSIGGTSILLAVTDSKTRGRWIGIQLVWLLAGSATGAILGGVLSDIIGFRSAMAVNGILSLSSIIAVYFLLTDIKGADAVRPTFRDIRNEYREKFDCRLYLAAAVLALSRFTFSGFVVALLSVIIREKVSLWITFIGVSTLSGILSSSKTAVSMIAAPAAGFLSDRLKNRWTTVIISLLCGSAGLLMITVNEPVITIAGILVCAIPGSSIMVLTRVLAGDLAGGKSTGRAIGFVHTAGDIGSAIGPPLAFFLLPIAGLNNIFGTLALLLAASAGAVYLADKYWKQDASRICAVD
jgi:MFS family permease